MIDGTPHFRGLRVVQRGVEIEGELFAIDALLDAADLLDQPDVAARFLKEDLAPYGLELWPSARMLAAYILREGPGDGRSAIEIGAGLGLPSFAAARAGWRVTLTDNEPMALQFAIRNARLNGVTLDAVAALDWRHPATGRVFDRVYAADVLYQLVDHAPLLRCIDALLAPGGTAVVVDPNRGVADRFADMAAQAGYAVAVHASSAPDHQDRPVGGRIHVLRRR